MQVQTKKKKEEKKSGGFASILEQVSGLLGGGSDQQEEEAQEFLIKQLGRTLNNDFTLLVDYPLPKSSSEIPMILIGPPGVRVIYPNTQRGIFRVKEDGWYEINARKQTFAPAKTNLVKKTLMMARGVQKFLADCGVNLEEIEPIMLFSEPGSHVDTSDPAIRIIPRDGINNFTRGLVQASKILKTEDVSSVAALITRPSLAKQQMAKARGEKPSKGPSSVEDEIFPSAVEDPPADTNGDDDPDWLKAIQEPDFEEEPEDVVEESDQLGYLMDRFSPDKISGQFNRLGFSIAQWVILAVFGGIICLTTLAAFVLLAF
ncbi:MAG: hypothetical protein IH859_01700 [Chloroflexi bacterium]|nr:hypothetical protein [Chloroflexota bacterium]